MYDSTISFADFIMPERSTSCGNIGECTNGVNSPVFYFPSKAVCSPNLPCLKYVYQSSIANAQFSTGITYRGFYVLPETYITRFHQRPALYLYSFLRFYRKVSICISCAEVSDYIMEIWVS